MTNELTILRFHGRDGGIPPVSPESVASILHNATDLFEYACRSSGLADSSARFEYFVAPRQGSLELVFRHVLDMVDASSGGSREGWETLGNVATVGGVIWVALFGGKGVVDLFRQGTKPEQVAVALPESKQASAVTEVRIKFTERLMVDRQAQQIVRALLDSCILPGVSRVEIEVLDERPVLLFGSDDRLQPQLLARGRRPGPNDLAARGIKEVSAKGTLVVRGSFKGKPVRIFLGLGATGPTGVGSETFVIVWASAAPIPPIGGWVEVRAEPLNAETLKSLKLDEGVPHEFEEAEGIVMVTAVSVWT